MTSPPEEPLPSFHVVIVAAGTGSRAGGDTPKQYRALAGVPVLRRTVDRFLETPGLRTSVVVIGANQDEACVRALGTMKPDRTVVGGATRRESVAAGLAALDGVAAPDDVVLIHDAARPFVSRAVIHRVALAAARDGAALPGVPVVDTVKRVDDGDRIIETVDRGPLRAAQTPQGFRLSEILAAHRDAPPDREATDDAALMELLGRSVTIVDGETANIKLTTSADFDAAEERMAARQVFRTGFGYDVHRLGPGDGVWLMGVRVPHDTALIGHSDADVGLHAVTDAVLGALAEGDIGSHFPPADPQWRGVSSDRFLAHAVSLAAARGARVTHLDATLVCEAPKIGPHRDAMRARVAEIVGCPPRSVSIKATTTEKLGFTGRGEGIACQAVATLSFPDETA
jgi:2-C-methyl-D-erythritol 4-phosphate cytidylyltransferase/2-C-methyl-D-erythritol 2,4-cyclodiphosphate synthase